MRLQLVEKRSYWDHMCTKRRFCMRRTVVEPLQMMAIGAAIAYRTLEDLCRAGLSQQTLDKHDSKTGHIFKDCGRESRKGVVLWSCDAGLGSASRMEMKKQFAACSLALEWKIKGTHIHFGFTENTQQKKHSQMANGELLN